MVSMRALRYAAVVALLLVASAADAQTVPARGAGDTFDVGSWNLEHFGNDDSGFGPSDEARQQANVAAVMRQAGVDLWALQEIGDVDAFVGLLDALDDEGYEGVIGPSTGGSFDLRLAFVYDADLLTLDRVRTVPGVSSSNFGGRTPYEVVFTLTLGGAEREVHVIDVHAKAGTSMGDWSTREDGAEDLKDYTDGLIADGASVILLGDLNDYLTGSITSGQASPYTPFVIDEDDYAAATLDIDRRRRPTFCGGSYRDSGSCSSGGSTRDHLLFSADLLDAYVPEEDDRYLALIPALDPYTTTTSDHLPVVARFAFQSVAAADGPEAGPVALLPAAPSPFRDATALRFRLEAPAAVRLEVFDVTGRRVASIAGPFGAGEHTVPLDGRALAPGAYVVRLAAEGVVQSRMIVRAD